MNFRKLLSLPIWFFIFYLIFRGNYNLIIRYEDNLHCTQYASYRIVVHEKEKHEEENSSNIPIYDSKYRNIIRVMFAIYFPTVLFLPLLFTIGKIRGIGAKKYTFLLVMLIAINIILAFIWALLGGERAGWMAKHAVIYTIVWIVLIVMGIAAEKGINVVFDRLQIREHQSGEE